VVLIAGRLKLHGPLSGSGTITPQPHRARRQPDPGDGHRARRRHRAPLGPARPCAWPKFRASWIVVAVVAPIAVAAALVPLRDNTLNVNIAPCSLSSS
jgi:hypothetical protein